MSVEPYEIYFWHSHSQKLEDKLTSIFMDDIVRDGDSLYYYGSLDEFAGQYGSIFMVRPNDKMICVTQHNSFSQRG